jgi:hypothetical protein
MLHRQASLSSTLSSKSIPRSATRSTSLTDAFNALHLLSTEAFDNRTKYPFSSIGYRQVARSKEGSAGAARELRGSYAVASTSRGLSSHQGILGLAYLKDIISYVLLKEGIR